MITSNLVGIIADDLTGANDTALQFKKRNAKVKILLDSSVPPKSDSDTEVWAISSESRNVDSETAKKRIKDVIKTLSTNLNLEYYYKKIDSTLRGNIAVEVLAMTEELDYDAAVIIPAFPAEKRITVGGYHLAGGVPIGRTEMACDPHSPITESHVPTLFETQLGEDKKELVGFIGLKTVLNGAGPILMKLNELIKEGKKIIVADSTSQTDIEQVILALNKSNYKILPAGTAAAGDILAKLNLPEPEAGENITPATIPNLPKLIISGSATQINANQIEQLEKSYDYDITSVSLTSENILSNTVTDLAESITERLKTGETVLVHSSKLFEDFDGFSDESLEEELTKSKLAYKITDFLAKLTKKIIEEQDVVLITLGGETSYKCCQAISSKELTMKDEVAPAIALCVDYKGQWIITKSGNLGNPRTLIEILTYIEKHEQIQ